MIKISRRERPTNTSRSFGRRKFLRAEVLLRAKSAARNPFVLSWQPEKENRPYANRLTKSRSLEIGCLTICRLQTCDRRSLGKCAAYSVVLELPVESTAVPILKKY